MRCLALILTMLVITGCSESVQLAEAANERDANEMLDVLDAAGVRDARKCAVKKQRDVSWAVSLVRGDAISALRVLNDHGLPRPARRGLRESFSASGLIQSELDERGRLMAAKEAEIEHMLEGVGGVVEARVNLALPAIDPFTRKCTARPTCAVALRILLDANGESPVDPQALSGVIAGSVDNLAASDVSMVISRVRPRIVASAASEPSLSLAASWSSIAGARPTVREWILLAVSLLLLVGFVTAGLTIVQRNRVLRDQRVQSAV